MKTVKKIKIGIMPGDQFRQRTLDIAAGRYQPAAGEPKIWFHSFKAMGEVLNDKNLELLKIIIEQKPQTLTELSEKSRRNISNLSRTMKKLKAYNLADLVRHGNSQRPVARSATFCAENYAYQPRSH